MDYSPLLRACLVSLDRWVVEGIEPPPSRHPRLADGSLVPMERLGFPRVPGVEIPTAPMPRKRLDYGPDWAKGILSRVLPETIDPPYTVQVPRVDGDGNEVAGIVLPELAVPVATHTGWNLRHPDIGGAEQLLVFAGATIPLARNRAEREATGDPRLSVAERYASREVYLDRVRRAALALAREGYLLEADVPLSVAAGARLWDHFTR